MNYTVFLELEPYLAQWLRHQSGGEYPIRIKRGSAEADLLECFLRPQPKDPDYTPQLKAEPGQVEIVLPWFKSKDIRTYNYLSPKAAVCLHMCIRNRFHVTFWKEMYTLANVKRCINISLEEWMEKNGIEVDDRNYNTLQKIFQRKRATYCQNTKLNRRKYGRRKKKSEANCELSQENAE